MVAAIATEYLDGIGYEANTDDEIVKISLDELNDIYAQLHEKYPDKEVYRPTTGSMSQFSNVDSLEEMCSVCCLTMARTLML